MLIKHYAVQVQGGKTLHLIQDVTDIWVHPNNSPTFNTSNEYFAYEKRDLEKENHKVITFQTPNGKSHLLRVFQDCEVYICNDDGKTIEKVLAY